MELEYDEKSGTWKIREEPYAKIEAKTEADWDILQNAVKLRNELAELGTEYGSLYQWVTEVKRIMRKYIDFDDKIRLD